MAYYWVVEKLQHISAN